MSNDPTAPIQITQVLPPRDTYSLDDHLVLGFAKREQLRAFLTKHRIDVLDAWDRGAA